MLGVTKKSAAAKDVSLTEWPEPEIGAGQVLVAVKAAGICGTDLHIYRNEYASNPPVILGHEVCGVVEKIGASVDPSWRGQRIVAETFFSTCGQCRYCRTGRPNLCAERRSIGSHVNGAMTERLTLPVQNLHRAPAALSDAAASMAEPVACVTNSLFDDYSWIEAGDRVLVIGPGAIGLIAAQVATALGACVTVRGTAKDGQRLELAARLGFETEIASDGTKGTDFDVAVECAGNGLAYADALHATRKAGRVIQMGLSGKTADLPVDLVCYKELQLRSGFASTPRSWRRAMQLLNDQRLHLEPLISDIIPLKDWRTGFDRSFAADGTKFVLSPEAGVTE
jgi:L-iditol 2-dehydrogenase